MSENSNNSILITKAQLLTIVGKIKGWLNGKVSTGSDAALNSVTLDDTITVSPYTDENEESYAEVSNGVMTDKVLTKMLVDVDGNAYYLPDSSVHNSDVYNDGGILLTTKNRSIPTTAITVSNTNEAASTASCVKSCYTKISVNSLYNNTLLLQLVDYNRPTNRCHEYFIDIDLTSYVGRFISVQFKSLSITHGIPTYASITSCWANGAPDWNTLRGKRILLHVVADVATWCVVSRGQESGSLIPDVPGGGGGIKGHGPLGGHYGETGAVEAVTDVTEYFQWILEETDGDGNQVIKPIWHIGNKKFIDAIGCVIYEPESSNEEPHT